MCLYLPDHPSVHFTCFVSHTAFSSSALWSVLPTLMGIQNGIPSNYVLFSRQLLRVVMWTRVCASSVHPLAATLASCSSWDSQTCCSGALCWDVLLCGPPLASVNLFRHQLPSGAYSDQIVTGPPRPRHFFHALWSPLALFCPPATPSTYHLLPL